MAGPDKKRKRQKDDQGEKNRKKSRKGPQADEQQQDAQPSTSSVVRITELCQSTIPPVVASSPGFPIPKKLSFRPFVKKGLRLHNGQKEKYEEFAMHSDDHPRVDYTARETGSQHQKHYIGIFDPATGKMRVIEAKRMEVTGSVRAREAPPEDLKPPEKKKNALEARDELLQQFGNKKARKLVEARTLNALPQTERDKHGNFKKLDAAAQIMVNASKKNAAGLATLEEINKRAEEARPAPKFNPNAESVKDVYRPEDVIGASILEAIPVKDWVDAMENDRDMQFAEKFVAQRIRKLCAGGNLTMLRVLRYIHFLLKLYSSSSPNGRERGTRRILQRDKLREALAPAPESVLDSIRRTFSKDGIMRSRHMDLLFTTCCALSCVIEGFKTDISDLEYDLKMERTRVVDYYREIGATVKLSTDPVSKKKNTIAFLALPLQFPQLVRRKRR